MVKRRLTLRAQPIRLARAADVMTPADQAIQRVLAQSKSVAEHIAADSETEAFIVDWATLSPFPAED